MDTHCAVPYSPLHLNALCAVLYTMYTMDLKVSHGEVKRRYYSGVLPPYCSVLYRTVHFTTVVVFVRWWLVKRRLVCWGMIGSFPLLYFNVVFELVG